MAEPTPVYNPYARVSIQQVRNEVEPASAKASATSYAAGFNPPPEDFRDAQQSAPTTGTLSAATAESKNATLISMGSPSIPYMTQALRDLCTEDFFPKIDQDGFIFLVKNKNNKNNKKNSLELS